MAGKPARVARLYQNKPSAAIERSADTNIVEISWQDIAELMRLKTLEEETRKLKRLVFDLSLDKQIAS